MSVEDIRNYRKVNDALSTGGQPTEEQLQSVAAEGFQRVINLATIDPRYALPDEAGLVRSLGMNYHHIPVDWENPTESDFAAFERLLQDPPPQKTFVHCAANYRVTAFYSLYAMKYLGWSDQDAEKFRASVWAGSSYPIWDKFICAMKERIRGSHKSFEQVVHGHSTL
jgi:protein tyrosine phosphatase (PTP) superfamily phosphohydrolase (DUF442 family)